MTRKRVLCVTYGGGHVAMLTPVISELQKDDNLDVVTLGLTTAKTYLESHNIPCLGYKDFKDLVDDEYKILGNTLYDEKYSSSLVSQEESVAYMGINMLDLIEMLGETNAYKAYEDKGRQAFLPVGFFKKLIIHLDIDIVIASNSPRSERAAIMAARELGVKSLCLIDLFALQEYKWIKDNSYADIVCVLNENVKRFLVSQGRESNHIAVTGNPAFDAINVNEKIENGKKLRSKLGKDKLVIFYASQVEPEEHPFNDLKGDPMLPRKIEKALRDFVRDNCNYKLLVRYHPSENVSFIEQESVEYAGGDLHSTLHAADVVVVTSSTVGLEAYIAGKAVISVDLSIFTPDAPYSAMGIAKGVNSLSELDTAIRQVQRGDREHLEQTKALDGIMQEITSLLSS